MKKIKFYGMELHIFFFFAIVIIISAWINLIPNQIIGGIAVLFVLGIVLGEIGEKIPIWNSYCGGGAILTFVVCGLLTSYNILPESVKEISAGWMNGYGILNLFICFLVVGSILGLDRKLLLKSSTLFIPTMLASILGAAIFGVIGGIFFKKNLIEILTAYVLPIMGGGAGAGAIPMAKVYNEVTGLDASSYLSFALAILAVGNIVAVIFAVILNVIGNLFPKFSGKGELVKRGQNIEVEEKNSNNVSMDDIAASIFLTAGFYIFSLFFAKKILPKIFGVVIPEFAYLIIFATLANVFKLIPENLKTALQKCQQFCASKLIWVQMAGCGITLINFDEMLSVLSLENLIIVILIVIGCCIGSALFGWIVGFYPVESAITGGLCMANMGGAGDLAVLGAAKRMELMSYAQISSRIGGAIVLLIGSLIFQFLV